MINDRCIDQAFSDLRSVCGGVREDYFGLLYLEQEHNLPRERAINHVAFGGHDYGVDGFYFDERRKNLYLLRSDLQIYYERQENAFDQLSAEDLADYGIREESKAIQMLKLTQTFLLTDGNISRLSEIRRVFEDDRVYDQVFRGSRLRADSREILLCYKVQFRLRKLASEIEQKDQNKYAFIHRSRYLLWALICQGLLNHPSLEDLLDQFGTSMAIPVDYTEVLSYLATARVRLLLSALMEHPDYRDKAAEGNLSFLRTDHAFDNCMDIAHKKWRWVHKKLA